METQPCLVAGGSGYGYFVPDQYDGHQRIFVFSILTMNYRTYNLIIAIPLLILFALFVALGVRMQPLDGDLTRLGAFTENDFGWNTPQERFETKLFDSESSSTYKRYYDIVVIGDSFSHHFPRSQWQNYLVQFTGLKIVSYHFDRINIDLFLNSPAFKKTPPKIMIFQTVERKFIHRAKQIGLEGDCERQANPKFASNPLTTNTVHYSLQPHIREAPFGLFHPNISAAVHFLKRNIKMIFNKKSIRTFKFPLKQKTFFSNRQSDYLLVYQDDVLKLNRKEGSVKKALCKILNLQNRIQENQKTFFVTLLAPDKLTAYSKFLQSEEYKHNSWHDMIASANQLNIPPVKAAFESAIGKNVLDVYLPNDTHWSSTGQRIAAETLYQYLVKRGMFVPAGKDPQSQGLP
jgi:hypothetical protein